MSSLSKAPDSSSEIRRYPRRALSRSLGLLCGGIYTIAQSSELGEGGISLWSEFVFDAGKEVVVSFQIPDGDFVFLRATIKSVKPQSGRAFHALVFKEIPFSNRRQIRSFVSEGAGEIIKD